MKRKRLYFAALAAIGMLLFGACQKEDNNTNRSSNGNGGNGTLGPMEWVDLGLPSGRLWAAYNLGATTPEGYGNYYAWGETQPKSNYSWSTYRYGSDSHKLTKYCSDLWYGLNGYTDNLTTLEPMDDAATMTLGNGACIPTRSDWVELATYTTAQKTLVNGVKGLMLTGSNGNTIFLPAAGYYTHSELYGESEGGYYWSSSLDIEYPSDAHHSYFDSYNAGLNEYFFGERRNHGLPVRAVRKGPSKWVDMGLPSGLLWATCNLGANAPEEYGNYYAWGETQPKDVYDWSTYRYYYNEYYLTKYCNDSENGYDGFFDNLTTLEAIDDAATAVFGSGAHTPTIEEWYELMDNTIVEWTIVNGVNGCRFTSDNGNSIFLPAAGVRVGMVLDNVGDGFYWSSSLYTPNPYGAFGFKINSDNLDISAYYRHYGFIVRAVRRK